MKDWPDLLARTYDVVRVPLAQVDDTHLDLPTPCTEWALRDLLGHAVGEIDMFTAAVVASGAPTAGGRAEGTPVERFDAAVGRNLAAWRAHDDPEATLSLPFGQFPAEVVAQINQFDSLVHAWDIGVSLGLPVALPADLSDVAMKLALVRAPMGRGHVFAAEVVSSSTDPGERLLAFTGRDPAAWAAPARRPRR